MPDQYQHWSGTGLASEGTQNVTLEAAPGVNKTLYLQKGVITVTVAATGAGNGRVALEDGSGGTKIINISGEAATNQFAFDFGHPGYPLTANTLLNLTVEGATTNEATARATVTGIIA